jgi:hypothetical protein
MPMVYLNNITGVKLGIHVDGNGYVSTITPDLVVGGGVIYPNTLDGAKIGLRVDGHGNLVTTSATPNAPTDAQYVVLAVHPDLTN